MTYEKWLMASLITGLRQRVRGTDFSRNMILFHNNKESKRVRDNL